VRKLTPIAARKENVIPHGTIVTDRTKKNMINVKEPTTRPLSSLAASSPP